MTYVVIAIFKSEVTKCKTRHETYGPFPSERRAVKYIESFKEYDADKRPVGCHISPLTMPFSVVKTIVYR